MRNYAPTGVKQRMLVTGVRTLVATLCVKHAAITGTLTTHLSTRSTVSKVYLGLSYSVGVTRALLSKTARFRRQVLSDREGRTSRRVVRITRLVNPVKGGRKPKA